MKSAPQTTTLAQDAKQVYQLFRPYFGFSKENRWRNFGLFAVLTGSLISSVLMVYIQSAFSAINVLAMTPGTPMSVLAWSISYCLVPLLGYAAMLSLCALATSWLSDNLSHELSKSLISNWIDKKAFYGLKFIHTKDSKINPGVVLGEDINEICLNSTTLASTFTQSFLDFSVGLYQLWYLSAPLVLSIASMTFAIPGYMVIAAVGYAAIFGGIVNYIDRNLKQVDTELKNSKDQFNAQLHHVEEHAETVAMKMGNQLEKKGILKNLDQLSVSNAKKRSISFFIDFAKNISLQISYLFGLALAAPGIQSGKLDASNAFSVAQYFTAVVNFFAWKKNNTIEISKLTVSLERFNAFSKLMVLWDDIQAKKQLKTVKSPSHFGVKQLTMLTPEGKTLLKDDSFLLPKGKITVIQGPSGVGKTTLFRCLADLWPYVEGELVLPADKESDAVKIHYIPQQAYFPCRSSLIEAINYPNEQAISKGDRLKVVNLMKKLGFKQETINSLDEKDEWGKRLSGGEKQRIAIISAIIKKPDILFIDEGTNGLDPKTKALVERALKTHLRGKTIVAIDHHVDNTPVTPFYDYALKMTKAKGDDCKISVAVEPLKTRSLRSQPLRACRTR